jgi:hypothetical protein
MWKSKPYVMLAKCAEALALRKGFPGQLQGLYLGEEYDASTPVAVSYPVDSSHKGHSSGEPAGDADEPLVDTEPDGEEPQVRMIDWFNGGQKPAEELIDKKNADAFVKKFVGQGQPFDHINHLKAHLRKNFHADTLAEMTWEKFGALINHAKSGVDDARWYAAEPQPVKADKAGASVDLDALARIWTKAPDKTFAELDLSLQARVQDMLALVDSGAIDPQDYAAMVEVLEA